MVHEDSHTNYFDSVADGNQGARIRAMKVDRYGVILGCPRSGTSFLGHSLRVLPHSEILFGYHLPVTVPHVIADFVISKRQAA